MQTLGFFIMDPVYLVLMVGLMLLMGLAQLMVRSAYSKYSRIPNQKRITGAEAAKFILQSAGIHDVRVEVSRGWLSDHYSPREKVLRLSPQNHSEASIAAVGIAAHEAGHAIQHARKYAPLVLRNTAVPMASLGSNLGWVVISVGLFIGYAGGNLVNPITIIGLGLIGMVAVFQIVNLPVEFDASRRALQVLPQSGILNAEETRGARSVLTAAALTYVAATVAAIAQLLYWAWRLGLLGGSRD